MDVGISASDIKLVGGYTRLEFRRDLRFKYYILIFEYKGLYSLGLG